MTRKVGLLLGVLLLAGTCLGVLWWTPDANSASAPHIGGADVSCFVGKMLAHDSARLHPSYIVRYLEGVAPVTDSAWAAPVFPYVLVCARFPQDGTASPSLPSGRIEAKP